MMQVDLFFEMGWFNHQLDPPFEATNPYFCRKGEGFFVGSFLLIYTG